MPHWQLTSGVRDNGSSAIYVHLFVIPIGAYLGTVLRQSKVHQHTKSRKIDAALLSGHGTILSDVTSSEK